MPGIFIKGNRFYRVVDGQWVRLTMVTDGWPALFVSLGIAEPGEFDGRVAATR